MQRPEPIPLQPGLVYGPVDSRRFGRSLGVNLLPADRKLCTMDCIYCQYRTTAGDAGAFPEVGAVLAAVEKALRKNPDCEAITIAGNGEPTLHPDFPEVVHGLLALRDRLGIRAKLCVLTNGTRLGRLDVREALEACELPVVKLDAGDDATLSAINRPRGSRLADIVEGLSHLRRFQLQALFVNGAVSNATDTALNPWLDLVRRLTPERVQVTTVDRGTSCPGVLPVARARLLEIARQVALRAGVPADVTPCRDEARFLG